MSIAQGSSAPARSQTRRTIVKGAAWTVPVIAMGAPAAHAGISQCRVENGAITIGPAVTNTLGAICTDQSQNPTATRIKADYGTVVGPSFIEICNCSTDRRWFRFREVDTLDDFQIEVNGLHNDQNSSTAGYRPPFQLNPVTNPQGSCQRFPLTYRTSVARGTTAISVTMDVTLQSSPTQTGPWTNVQVFAGIPLAVRRTTTDPVNFNSCPARSSARSAAAAEPSGTGD